ncbi:type VII secretion protein EccB [Nocardioides pantholopis]|uniref:type VII secretion protein EccB n=1 Tax=Nocardioides pantholopis TaxID=2483798 RepID=UPI0013DE7484|nr:type VII secretion protein EccB [Nocardioides pantholopis]
MATKRDLVEAYSFSRRRLVTAFVSGAPGGREVEPARPLRTILAGVALSVLLLAGAAVAGVVSGRDPVDWSSPGLLLTRDTGGLYVILEESEDPRLHPVLNITSGRLIMGADARPTVVSAETVADQEVLGTLGIFGSPEQVPSPSRLIGTGWTACTEDGAGVAVDLAEEPRATPDAALGFTVRSGGRLYVLAQGREERDRPLRAYRYEVPDTPGADSMLQQLGVRRAVEAVEVPEQWVDLFPAGGRLDHASFALEGFGAPAPETGGRGLPAGSLVGQVITVGGEDPQLLTADGPVELDPFSFAVYLAAEHPRGVDIGPVDLPAAPQVSGGIAPFLGAHWPDRTLEPTLGAPCAVLDTAAGRMPAVHLATDPTGSASAADVEAGSRRISVEDGHGAYVVAGSWDDTAGAAAYLADPLGLAYPLEGDDTAERLGYADHDPPLVPDAWVGLFDEGAALSRDAALCPPTRDDAGRACESGDAGS